MNFDDKVKFLRTLPAFKVIPISEVRAVAYAAKEINEPDSGHRVLGKFNSSYLVLEQEDIEKITRAYPDLSSKLI
jgi:hypothetical protein